MKNEKTDEQLKKEMIKKVDVKKCKKLIAMSFRMRDSEIEGFDTLLEDWANSKVHLYRLLGEELKIEKDLDIDVAEAMKSGVSDIILQTTGIQDKVIELIEGFKDKVPALYYIFNNCFYYSDVAREFPNMTRRCISSSYMREKVLNGEDIVTFSKAMHRLFNNELVDTEISKFIQENAVNKVTGKMYLSIDPFDYLTMSVNKSNWESCLSLHKYPNQDEICLGQYAAGVFSYICDKVTMVAYRTDGKERKFGWSNRSFMAESKNWRQLIYIEKDFDYFINSRQYPYTSEILSRMVRGMIEEKIGEQEEESETSQNEEKKTKKWKVSRNNERNRRLVKDNEKPMSVERLHYNDVLAGRDFEFTYKKKFDDLVGIVVGSRPKCPLCGRNLIKWAHKPVCGTCEGKFYSN